MRGEIICIGDELITGRVAEVNAAYAASRLTALGAEIAAIVVVGDDSEAIKDSLNRALGRADFVIVTGGLGATDDDITAQVAADVFNLPLTESARMIANLRAFFQTCGLEPDPAYEKLSWLPRGAEVLDTLCAGFSMTSPEGKPVFFLPGVPAQMRRLTKKRVLPRLASQLEDALPPRSVKLKVFGLPEPEVGARLSDLSRAGMVSLGYYPVFPEVHVVITVHRQEPEPAAELLARTRREACRRLEGFVFSIGGEKLEEVVAGGMEEQGLSLALAESCTGGLVGHRITGVAGSSNFFDRGFVVYSNQAKIDLLGVRPETLIDHGAVSLNTAREMAAGAKERAGVDLGLGITGIAGPGGGTMDKPVGTVCFGLAAPEGVKAKRYLFHGNRGQIKAQAAACALDWLRRYLADHAFIHSA